MSLHLRTPRLADWSDFYRLAAAEGWLVPDLEKHLFRTLWPSAAWTLLQDGFFCGLVTAVRHERSAWLGNLLVPRERRRRGHGRRLFKAALAGLEDRGTHRIWLTASAQGRALYEKAGFVAVDRIERWILPPGARPAAAGLAVGGFPADLYAADRDTWGEDRGLLLAGLAEHGQLFAAGGAVALLQDGRDLQVIGPWYAPPDNLAACRSLLQTLLADSDPALEVVMDLRASSGVSDLLADSGFRRSGENLLMASGSLCRVDLKGLVALASLGSVG